MTQSVQSPPGGPDDSALIFINPKMKHRDKEWKRKVRVSHRQIEKGRKNDGERERERERMKDKTVKEGA